jgi:alpha-1,2-rhamnosyltransferase
VRRVFIECTHTFYNGRFTGIQRVVRALAAHAQACGQEYGLDCRPVVWSAWGFIAIGELPRDGKRAFTLIKNLSRSMYHAAGLNPADPGHAAAIEPYGTPSPRVVTLRRLSYLLASALCHGPQAVLRRRVRLGEGDVLLLADASWNQPMWSDLERAQGRGCRVGVLVYDVLAATHPEWFDPPLAASFQDWLVRALAQCQFFVGISEATRQAVEFLPQPFAVARKMPGASFRLGVDESLGGGANMADTSEPAAASAPVAAAFGLNEAGRGDGPRRICLAVGTIEPRKNHRFLIEGFELAARQDPTLDLVLVGRPGWRCGDLIAQIRQHPLYGKRIWWLDDVSDRDLDVCYHRADLLACLSLAEGFGLPVIEGLARGLPVVCSDLPVFREVGGDYPVYVPLGDLGGLARALLAVGKTRSRHADLTRIRGFTWPDWHTSTQELLSHTLRLAGEVAAARESFEI